jgi:hypothetical protein
VPPSAVGNDTFCDADGLLHATMPVMTALKSATGVIR